MKNKTVKIILLILLVLIISIIYIVYMVNNYKSEFNEKIDNMYDSAIENNHEITRGNTLYKIDENGNKVNITLCADDYYDIIEYEIGNKEIVTTTYFDNNVYCVAYFTDNIRPYQIIGDVKYKGNKMIEIKTLKEACTKEEINRVKEKYEFLGYAEVK